MVRENVGEIKFCFWLLGKMSMKLDFAFGGYGKCLGNKILLVDIRENVSYIRFFLWRYDFAFGG